MNQASVDASVAELMTAFEEFKTRYDGKIGSLADYLEKMEAKLGRPGAGGASGFTFGSSDLEAERKSVNAYVRGEFKDLISASDPTGGYFVPEILQQTITEKLYNPPTMLSIVRTETWDGPGSAWIEPLKRALLTARRRGSEREAAQDTGTTDPVGLLIAEAGEAEAMITLSQRLIDDANRDLSAMVVGDINAAFDRQLDAEIISGTGTGQQALGFLSVPIVTTDDTTRAWGQIQYFPSGASTSVTADALKDVVYGCRAPYRTGASWVMSSATANFVDKLKDGDGAYLWRNQMTAGTPPTLLGFPVNFDENMPTIGAGTYPIAFGNWRLGYLAVKKLQTRLLRDPYTNKPNLVLYGYKRQGGIVANSEAIKVMKVGTT